MSQDVSQAPAPQVVYVQQPSRKTSGMSVASLVLGILWLGGFGALLATIFGAVGLKQTKDGQRGGRGLAIAGLILGIVGILGSVVMFVAIAGTAAAVDHAAAEASARIDLEDVALSEESYKVVHGHYTDNVAKLDVTDTDVSVRHASKSTYCLSATDRHGTTWYQTQKSNGDASKTPC